MPWINSNGADIFYEQTGEGDPIVLVTGLAGDIGFWSKALKLIPQGYSVVLIDNRGSGKTRSEGRFTINDMAEDIATVVKHLGLGKVHIMGWSMGSHISLEFAARHPDMVRSLTLVSSYLRRSSRSAYALGNMAEGLFKGEISCEYVGMFMNVLLRTEDFFRSAEDTGRPIRTASIGNPEGMYLQMQAVEGYDPIASASSIPVPVLSVHGLDDIMVPPESGDELADIIPRCTRYRVPGEGHIIRLESYFPRFIEFIGSL